MQNSDFQKSCISMRDKAISEIAKTAIFTNWLLSSGGKAISEMCKTVIFKNHCISIGGRAISEIAKTLIFTNCKRFALSAEAHCGFCGLEAKEPLADMSI